MLRPAAFNTPNHRSAPQMLTKCLLCAGGPILDPEGSVEGGGAHSEQENQAPRREIPTTPMTDHTQKGRILTSLLLLQGKRKRKPEEKQKPFVKTGHMLLYPF